MPVLQEYDASNMTHTNDKEISLDIEFFVRPCGRSCGPTESHRLPDVGYHSLALNFEGTPH